MMGSRVALAPTEVVSIRDLFVRTKLVAQRLEPRNQELRLLEITDGDQQVQVRFQPIQSGDPPRSNAIRPFAEVLDRLGVQPVEPPLRMSSPMDDARLAEHPEMPGDGGPAHLEGRR
jgi:hypothetical protein